ncbi:FtsH protease activity modulator HflK [Luteibacter aegosomatissinici]|uniref:FtsH protease activity modulator HflK n=1 Tax=Luteibacter aegosomatissinici TaxID=2911539 RepID=UPI001FF9B9FD|nr:FtsH protease activity modulator HflK [Luteibacter aegosomatissinici]UPG93193.1 FtsH protease activity modulator HflK [Luteibacter aegosomatissinici]
MPWNEPGNGQKDPWNRNRQGQRKFDLDSLLKQVTSRFGRFGAGSGGVLAILLVFAVAWLLVSSFTVIDARQVGVVLRFGQFARVLPPGMHLKAPNPIETVTKVETTQVRTVSDTVSMLTRDENIIAIDFNIQYQVSDARKFLFSNADNAENMLKNAAEAAVRSVVGANAMDNILTTPGADASPAQAPGADASPEAKETLQQQTRSILQSTLDMYDSGIAVTGVSFQSVSPPQQVKDAFDDVNAAREDRQRAENEALAYQSKVLPEARGEAARIAGAAEADKVERIAAATGDADRFNLLLKEYRAAPDVTRRRLWLETVEDVMSHNPKVVDGTNGKNLIQLPVEAGNTSVRNVPGVGTVVQSASTDAAPAQQGGNP